MSLMAEVEIQNKMIKGLTLKVAGSILIGVISVTTSIVMGFNSLQAEVKEIKGDVKSIRYEFRSAIDSVKYKMQLRSIETDAKFQRVDDKLIRIESNTSNNSSTH